MRKFHYENAFHAKNIENYFVIDLCVKKQLYCYMPCYMYISYLNTNCLSTKCTRTVYASRLTKTITIACLLTRLGIRLIVFPARNLTSKLNVFD